jgi:hypothetical protein
MFPLPPRTTVFRSLFINRITFRLKPARSLVLLCMMVISSAALASSVVSAGSLRQLIFGSAFGSGGGRSVSTSESGCWSNDLREHAAGGRDAQQRAAWPHSYEAV